MLYCWQGPGEGDPASQQYTIQYWSLQRIIYCLSHVIYILITHALLMLCSLFCVSNALQKVPVSYFSNAVFFSYRCADFFDLNHFTCVQRDSQMKLLLYYFQKDDLAAENITIDYLTNWTHLAIVTSRKCYTQCIFDRLRHQYFLCVVGMCFLI